MFLIVVQHQVRAWSKGQNIAVTELLLNLLIVSRGKDRPEKGICLFLLSEYLNPLQNEVIVANISLGR
mgnify:CR=1 FL=1